jgi:hypothetical protein
MKSNFSANPRRIVIALLACSASVVSVLAHAQGAVQYKPPSPNGPISAPTKLPPQLLPDLKIDLVTGSSAKTYVAKIVNVGAITSGASNIYCAATVSNATHHYTIEHMQPIPALSVNGSHTVNCDFGNGAKRIKPGEKLLSVNFHVNNQKTIRESNYANNELRTNVK